MYKYLFSFLIPAFLLHIGNSQEIQDGRPTPIVLWHGMGDSCCFPFSLGGFQEELNGSLPGVYIVSLRIGDSLVQDVENGYFMHPNDQIKLACDTIKEDSRLANGFNAIGFSQGAQFLYGLISSYGPGMRGLVQRCPGAKVKNLISLGGQHQGVYGLPNCGSLRSTTCDYIRKLLNHAAYVSWVQERLVQATYWHDPLDEAKYKNYSTFIAEINNELEINADYVERLQTLENFVMVKFGNDTMVEPVATEWFGFYKPGQSTEVQGLEETDLYIKDRLGLKKMKDDSKLHFLSTPGNHLRFEWSWFVDNILEPFLKN